MANLLDGTLLVLSSLTVQIQTDSDDLGYFPEGFEKPHFPIMDVSDLSVPGNAARFHLLQPHSNDEGMHFSLAIDLFGTLLLQGWAPGRT
jgi:hypothetical protein